MTIKDFTLEEKFDLFKNVPLPVQEEIKKSGMLMYYPKGKMIFSKNEPLNYLYLIVNGNIHINKEDLEGKEQIVSILKDGDFFPHIGLFDKTATPGIAYAVEESYILLVPIQSFQSIALNYPVILMEYSKVLSQKIIELQSRLEEKAFFSAFQQVVRRLLFLIEQHGKPVANNKFELTISLTHEELSNLVGTTRETVSRSITKLKKEKALEIINGSWILNPSVLKRLL